MAKKFGKVLLTTAAISAAAVAAYCYFRKKDAELSACCSDDDYDDFSDDPDEDLERNYVSLDGESVKAEEDKDDAKNASDDDFTSLADKIAEATDDKE